MNDKIKRIDEFKNTNEFKTIQDLLDKYMDGATSNEEEATLRKYFEEHGNDIPEEWESYRALFSYIGFEQMNLSQILKGEEEKEEDFEKKDIEKEEIPKKEASRSRWLKYFGTSVAAAAIIAEMISRSLTAESRTLAFSLASPTPMLITILSSFGTCITFLYPNFLIRASTNSF